MNLVSPFIQQSNDMNFITKFTNGRNHIHIIMNNYVQMLFKMYNLVYGIHHSYTALETINYKCKLHLQQMVRNYMYKQICENLPSTHKRHTEYLKTFHWAWIITLDKQCWISAWNDLIYQNNFINTFGWLMTQGHMGINSKILIVSLVCRWLVFQNLVTYKAVLYDYITM